MGAAAMCLFSHGALSSMRSGAFSSMLDTVGAAPVDEQDNTVPGMPIAHIATTRVLWSPPVPAAAVAARAHSSETAASGARDHDPPHGTPRAASALPALTPPRL